MALGSDAMNTFTMSCQRRHAFWTQSRQCMWARKLGPFLVPSTCAASQNTSELDIIFILVMICWQSFQSVVGHLQNVSCSQLYDQEICSSVDAVKGPNYKRSVPYLQSNTAQQIGASSCQQHVLPCPKCLRAIHMQWWGMNSLTHRGLSAISRIQAQRRHDNVERECEIS